MTHDVSVNNEEEGVVKYHSAWKKSAPQQGAKAQSLCEWRDRFFDLGLIHVDEQGIGFGNISLRLLGYEFLITGTQTGHEKRLSPRGCSLVTSVAIEENSLHCEGAVAASSEALTHAAIYQLDAEIQAVVHVHHKAMWRHYMGRLPTTKAEAPYGTTEMAHEVQRVVKSQDLSHAGALVMKGHEDGLLSYGPSLTTASAYMMGLLEGFGPSPPRDRSAEAK